MNLYKTIRQHVGNLKDEFDVDMYFDDAPVRLLIIETMEVITLPTSSWLAMQDYNFDWAMDNFEVIN